FCNFLCSVIIDSFFCILFSSWVYFNSKDSFYTVSTSSINTSICSSCINSCQSIGFFFVQFSKCSLDFFLRCVWCVLKFFLFTCVNFFNDLFSSCFTFRC